jgi:hypothetical protein
MQQVRNGAAYNTTGSEYSIYSKEMVQNLAGQDYSKPTTIQSV